MYDEVALSEHFTLGKMIHSDKAIELGVDNTPPVSAVVNLTRLTLIAAEPARLLLGVAMLESSGYRCPIVNAAVGGAADSAHLDGRAGDYVPLGLPLETAFDLIRHSTIPYDQLIIERSGDAAWLHIGIAKVGIAPRRQTMTAVGGPGHWVYTEVAP